MFHEHDKMLGFYLLVVVSTVFINKANSVDSTQPPDYNVTLCNDGDVTEVLLRHQSSVSVRSPNIDERRTQGNIRCKVVFKTGPEALFLIIQYNSFDLELVLYPGSCDYTWLCVHGVRFCGDWPSNRIFEYIVPANSTFTMYFKSDVMVTKAGFEAVVQAFTATSSHVTVADAGNGASEKHVAYVTTVFNDQFAKTYRDKCNGNSSQPIPDWLRLAGTSSP
ncbi:uncharacterized protein LOC131953034 [Physella acuta]|uniref:uncharacterized protein LOC131953034 n=1 Tax=Physella acuta TaxID=109671 RepID=UPI0027DC0D3E|nr:uncharacterized protein LOC131953034 [Physella acuta]